MNVEKLQAIVLGWAKEHHPEKYAATLKVARQPVTYQNYLLRLLEIRWTEENGPWKMDVELLALEETAIQQPLTFHGHPLVFAGKKVADRDWSFAELNALTLAEDGQVELERLRQIKSLLDLTVVEVTTEGGGR